MMITLTRPMLEELLALTVPGDGEDEPVEVSLRHFETGPEGPGLYAYYTEYPEEGVTLIDGKSDVLRAEGRASIAGVLASDAPSEAQLMAIWQRHGRMGPPMPSELCGFAREVLSTYGVNPSVFHCAREGMCDATPRCTVQCAACADGVGGMGHQGVSLTDADGRKDALLRQAKEALDTGRDAAYEQAQQYHAAMAGYRPREHAQHDADVAAIDAAIAAITAELEKQHG